MPKTASALLLVLSLSACSVYRLDVQQGNVLTDHAVSSLKIGMTKRQVRFLLGTPPVADPFHADQWNYVYYLRKRGKPAKHERRVTLTFQGDTLAHIDAHLPSVAMPDTSVKG